jgi:hypothetical protein
LLLPAVLLLGLILPHLKTTTTTQRWLLPCASSGLGVLLLVLAT